MGKKYCRRFAHLQLFYQQTKKNSFILNCRITLKKGRGIQVLFHGFLGLVQHRIQHVLIRPAGRGWSMRALQMIRSYCPTYLHQWWTTQNLKRP